MELGEAKKRLSQKLKSEEVLGMVVHIDKIVDEYILDNIAIKTVLQELKDKDKKIEFYKYELATYKKEESELYSEIKNRGESLKNSIPKEKIEEIIQNKSVSMFEGNAEYPNNAEEIKLVEYIKTDDLKELIK